MDLDIVFDTRKMTIEDWVTLHEMQQGLPVARALVEMLDRCAVGGIKHLPMDTIKEVSERFAEAFAEQQGTPEQVATAKFAQAIRRGQAT